MIFIATCQIWKIKNNLNNVIKYINNKDKINEDLYVDLHNELEYISNDYKTEEKLYVSGINCNVENAYEEMMKVKKEYGKTDGIIAWHSFQSFKEGEVTPEEAHNVGVELANEVWGDKFQVVVATHLNTKHIHNHFVINSVSFKDGSKYYATRSSYAFLREMNDNICREHGLSYMKEKTTKKGINYKYYQNNYKENNNYKSIVKRDINLAIFESKTYEEFENNLRKYNYEVKYRYGVLTIRNLDYKRNFRVERQLGKDYSIDNIKKQILGLYIPESNYKNDYKKDKTLEVLFKTNQRGLAYTYIKYLKLLNNYPKYVKNTKISYSLRSEINNMDMISKETILLANNNIETEEELVSFYFKLKDSYEETKDKKIKEDIKLVDDIFKKKNIFKEDLEKIEKEVIIR